MDGDVAPRGKTFTKPEFLEIIDDLRNWVEHDDTMEGSLAYEQAWGDDDDPETFKIQGALRFGNSMGQGSVRLLTDPNAPMGFDQKAVRAIGPLISEIERTLQMVNHDVLHKDDALDEIQAALNQARQEME